MCQLELCIPKVFQNQLVWSPGLQKNLSTTLVLMRIGVVIHMNNTLTINSGLRYNQWSIAYKSVGNIKKNRGSQSYVLPVQAELIRSATNTNINTNTLEKIHTKFHYRRKPYQIHAFTSKELTFVRLLRAVRLWVNVYSVYHVYVICCVICLILLLGILS